MLLDWDKTTYFRHSQFPGIVWGGGSLESNPSEVTLLIIYQFNTHQIQILPSIQTLGFISTLDDKWYKLVKYSSAKSKSLFVRLHWFWLPIDFLWLQLQMRLMIAQINHYLLILWKLSNGREREEWRGWQGGEVRGQKVEFE